MRKWMAIGMMAIYGIMSIGVHLHLHYCCDKLEDIGFLSAVANCCEAEQDDQCNISPSCCANEKLDFQLDDEQRLTSALRIFQKFIPAKVPHFEFSGVERVLQNHPDVLLNVPPPRNIPIYTLNCSLVLYA
ncbi:MAG: hypothetical protein IT223_10905 [Crocinitomicaceae bacterium]|nr:hypothetical protein [Crocinitomicaceae bacterium]